MHHALTSVLALVLGLMAGCSPPVAEGPGGLATTTGSSTGAAPGSTTHEAPGPEPTTSGLTTGVAMDSATTGTQETGTSLDPGSSGEAPAPGCGDGVLDPETEACDEGYGRNSDMAGCTLECALNVCGDGLLHVGVEDCDQGANNNDSPDNYGGCGTDCRPTSYCGDAELQGSEECDFGVHNGSGSSEIGGVSCDDTCRFAAKLCFLTSAVYEADALGSAEEADQICRAAALAAGYDNATAFKAWVSDDASSPASRFTPSQIPFVLANGVRVANHSKQLMGTGPLTGITHTDKGEDLIEAWVWTGTAPNGTLLDPALDCQGWTSKGFVDSGRIGRSGVDEGDPDELQVWKSQLHWTSYKTMTCIYKYHLYCFEN